MHAFHVHTPFIAVSKDDILFFSGIDATMNGDRHHIPARSAKGNLAVQIEVVYKKLQMAIARRFLDQAPITLKLVKMHVYKGLNMSLDEYLELAADAEAMTTSTADAAEALAAHREKRKPQFIGC